MEAKQFFGTQGVVIHLTRTDDGTDPLDNMAEHVEASKRNSQGQFYFSCSYYFEDLSDVDYLLLYCNNAPSKEHFFFIAKVEPKSESRRDAFCPDDAADYSPEKWADVDERTWFMLSNLRTFVSSDELKRLTVISEGRETRFLDRIKTDLPLGRCYVSGSLCL